jgi:hypothetical protein
LRCVTFVKSTAGQTLVRLYIARAGARLRLQIESGGVQLLGGVRRSRFASNVSPALRGFMIRPLSRGPPCGNRAAG